jgi:hypothetical protein
MILCALFITLFFSGVMCDDNKPDHVEEDLVQFETFDEFQRYADESFNQYDAYMRYQWAYEIARAFDDIDDKDITVEQIMKEHVRIVRDLAPSSSGFPEQVVPDSVSLVRTKFQFQNHLIHRIRSVVKSTTPPLDTMSVYFVDKDLQQTITVTTSHQMAFNEMQKMIQNKKDPSAQGIEQTAVLVLPLTSKQALCQFFETFGTAADSERSEMVMIFKGATQMGSWFFEELEKGMKTCSKCMKKTSIAIWSTELIDQLTEAQIFIREFGLTQNSRELRFPLSQCRMDNPFAM